MWNTINRSFFGLSCPINDYGASNSYKLKILIELYLHNVIDILFLPMLQLNKWNHPVAKLFYVSFRL